MKGVHIIVLLGLLIPAAAAGETSVKRLENIERKILSLVNDARSERGLAPLKWNDKLAKAAGGHLALMIEKKNLAHQLPGEGPLTSRIAATGLRFNASAENVAFATEWEDLHPGLMQSAGHRANILSPKYNEVGIAVALGGNGYYAVQNFARTTNEWSPKEAELRLAAELRQRFGRGLEVIVSPAIRNAMCEMAEDDQVSARRVPAEMPRRRTFAFTASEPEDLPEKLTGSVSGSLKAVEVGICYKATAKYPGGTYWIGMAY